MSFAAPCFIPWYAIFWPPERSSHFAVTQYDTGSDRAEVKVEEVVGVEKDDDVDSGKSPDCESSWLIASLSTCCGSSWSSSLLSTGSSPCSASSSL